MYCACNIRKGCVGICGNGRPGVITGTVVLPYGESFIGYGLDGLGEWASSEPTIVANSPEEFFVIKWWL